MEFFTVITSRYQLCVYTLEANVVSKVCDVYGDTTTGSRKIDMPPIIGAQTYEPSIMTTVTLTSHHPEKKVKLWPTSCINQLGS